jgi:hypothetical protein
MKFDNIELIGENIHGKYLQLIQKIRQRGLKNGKRAPALCCSAAR